MIPEFQRYLLALHDQFAGRVHELREKRAQVLKRALQDGAGPAHLPPSDATAGDWSVPEVPEELYEPGIEISGPASVTGMFINALNPGPGGFRAQGDLDDDEDSAGHRLVDTLQAAANRRGAVERTLTFYNAAKGKKYELAEGDLPFFMHRERGLHLDEPEVLVDGAPISASILGTALTLFHAGQAQARRGQGIYFYLPKMESAEEAGFWRDFFAASQDVLPDLRSATIRAIALVESVPAAFQMEEILHALGEYSAGLNAARWDFKASILEYVMADPDSVWPDRFDVDIKSTDFLTRIFRRLVAICLKRGAVPIGGMATALPSRDAEVNQLAAEAIRSDKQWEAEQGFLRGWVAHIFHMKTAADPFRELRGSGWTPSPEMARPENYPIEIAVPEGTRHRGGDAPECTHVAGVPGGLAQRAGRQGDRQSGGAAGQAAGPDGRSGHGADLGGPDCPKSDSRSPGCPDRPEARFRPGQEAAGGGAGEYSGIECGELVRRRTLSGFLQDRPAVGQELHGTELQESGLLHARRPGPDRRRCGRFLIRESYGASGPCRCPPARPDPSSCWLYFPCSP